MSYTFDHVYRPFQSGQPAARRDIEALEAAAHCRLPADYKSFLLKCNGGSLRPFAFKLDLPGSDFNESVHALDYFYELKEIHQDGQLETAPNLRNIPPGRLAIATTVSELTITLNMTEGAHGEIEAWVRDTFNVWGEGANRTIVPLAENFTAFLGILHDEPEAYSSFWARFGRDGETARRISLP
ncbi:MAG: SMI1/KNR4 family protein [Elusimicrobia bacterium]|nr:SMI1/KNR4 family protein [Elusimicrobiota bacterium]